MSPPKLDFSARSKEFDNPNIILATPSGYMFRLHSADGRLLAYAASDPTELLDRGVDHVSSTGRSFEWLNRVRWSAMAVSPDGRFMVLADAGKLRLYLAYYVFSMFDYKVRSYSPFGKNSLCTVFICQSLFTQ